MQQRSRSDFRMLGSSSSRPFSLSIQSRWAYSRDFCTERQHLQILLRRRTTSRHHLLVMQCALRLSRRLHPGQPRLHQCLPLRSQSRGAASSRRLSSNNHRGSRQDEGQRLRRDALGDRHHLRGRRSDPHSGHNGRGRAGSTERRGGRGGRGATERGGAAPARGGAAAEDGELRAARQPRADGGREEDRAAARGRRRVARVRPALRIAPGAARLRRSPVVM